ncbi:hypothetical protein AB1L42_12435 [Thalassoglobus sp. JC818]|uniref:hypothetical protein n=1 Tax=Thalassoglobus sp. JC818 TaxID=3232136 RepID=UPI00345A36ED
MPVSLADVGYGFLLPAFAALMSLVLLRRMLPEDAGRRYVPMFGLVLGFQLGYWLLNLGQFPPAYHFHWLPIAMILVGLTSAVTEATGSTIVDRILMYAVVSLIGCWFLLPNYPGLPLPWQYTALIGSAVITIVSLASRPLVKQLSGPLLTGSYFSMLAIGAVMMVLSGSIGFGQITGAATGACFGLFLAALLDPKANEQEGLAFPVIFFAFAMMMIGQTNSFSNIPQWAYYILPLTPIGMWESQLGFFKSMGGIGGSITRYLVAIHYSLIALGIALYAEFAS